MYLIKQGENNMGLLKGHIQDWLEEFGYDLGYSMSNLTDLSDMTPDCQPS